MQSCSLLHVEDDDASAFLLRAALDEANLRVSVYRVSDGDEALAFLRKTGVYEKAQTPRLVLLDLNMPRVDGWTILAERQEDSVLKVIPFIVLSTASRSMFRAKALAKGALEYLEKPNSFEVLVQQVREHCGPLLTL